ncbi:MAG: DUF3611 family protein [Thiogranum sp.]
MNNKLSVPWQPANPERLAKQFSRLGWLGFWIQLALLAVPIALLVYVLLVSSAESAQRRGIDLGNYLSYGSLLVMVFTTFWFYRYTRLGKRIADPDLRPPQSSALRTLWIGLWVGCLGIFFSMLLLLNAVGRMLFVLMANPQTGMMIAQGMGTDPTKSLSAMDAVSLTSLLVLLTAELLVLTFSLWLLFRTTRPSAAIAEAATDGQEADTQER